MPGIEPGTSHMRSERSTTELHPLMKRELPKRDPNRRTRTERRTWQITAEEATMTTTTTSNEANSREGDGIAISCETGRYEPADATGTERIVSK